MRTLPWRALLVLSLACVSLVATIAGPAAAQAVRKSITALPDAEIMSLRRGVATMMARNGAARNSANFRRSWIYWANMHGHFGDDCAGPVTGGGMNGVTRWTAVTASEQATWCTCEHNTAQFLTWHRMYLYYFERVLRQASGDPNLTLPYWDYATDSLLPPALRDQTYVDGNGQTVPNPLYVPARQAAINAGTAGLAAGTVSSANAMGATTHNTFRMRLEGTPHGTVHCALASGGCPTGLMGAVPAAALDPVFYLHHSNIDRLYECWLRVDQAARLPNQTSVLNKQYSFIEGDGSVKKRRVRDMLTTSSLGYGYVAGAGCPAPGAKAVLVADNAPAERTAPMATSGGFEIGRGTTEVPVEVEASGAGERSTAAAAAPVRSAIVTVEGLEAPVVPGVLFNVYLTDGSGRREQIGVIDFFDFGGFAGQHAGHGGTARSYEFDATAAVRALGLRSTREPRLVFEPTTGLTNSTPEIASARIPADARVTFQRARLRVVR